MLWDLSMFCSVANSVSFSAASRVVTVFNACPHEVSMEIPDLMSMELQLHPVQVTNCFSVFAASIILSSAKYINHKHCSASVVLETQS